MKLNVLAVRVVSVLCPDKSLPTCVYATVATTTSFWLPLEGENEDRPFYV